MVNNYGYDAQLASGKNFSEGGFFTGEMFGWMSGVKCPEFWDIFGVWGYFSHEMSRGVVLGGC